MNPDITSWRVLAVDDEPDNLLLIRYVMEIVGATVLSVDGGQQGLDLVDEFQPMIILLDLRMPGVDGWEVHRRLRGQPKYDHIPIIAITAHAMAQDIKKAKEAGFDGYITKPIDISKLPFQLVEYWQAFNKRRVDGLMALSRVSG